ncbi:MAG: NrsF family protein [bacterium]|nr:NrsF family protein [bacterium]
MNNQQLIDSLSRQDCQAVRSPWMASLMGVGASLFFFLAVSWYYGLRSDLADQALEPLFITHLALLGGSALVSAALACYLAIPRMDLPRWLPSLGFLPLTIWVSSLLFQLAHTLLHYPEQIYPQPMDRFCIQSFMLFLVLPGAYMLFQVKRLAPVLPHWSGALSVLFATSMGNFALMLLESNDNLYHQTAWHLIPTIMFTLGGFFLGPKILKW